MGCRTTLFMLYIFVVLFSGGCAFNRASPPYREEKALTGELGISPSFLDEKINKISTRLKGGYLTEDHREVLNSLLDMYRSLKDLSSRQYVTRDEYRYLLLSMLDTLDRVEQGYLFLLQRGHDTKSTVAASLIAMQLSVPRMYMDKDYQGVIDTCLKLRAMYGPDAISPWVGACFAMSLYRKGLVKEAIRIGYESSRRMKEYPDPLILEGNIAKWQLQTGAQRRALGTIQRLSHISQKRAEELEKIYLEAISSGPGRDGHAPALEPRIGNRYGDRVRTPFPEVNRLLAQHRFKEARNCLLKREDDSSVTEEEVKRVLLSVSVEENNYVTKMLASIRGVMDRGMFEKALALIREVESHCGVSKETLVLKRDAVSGLMTEERNRAARLFLLAKRSTDPSRKRTLLKSSYHILETLVQRYPSSPLIDKVRANMKSVKRELSRIQ